MIFKGGSYIKIINITDNEYPSKLREIPNPPKVLYAKGNIDLLNKYSISIIGSRSCSKNGIALAKYFSKTLSSLGITIISGLAKRN